MACGVLGGVALGIAYTQQAWVLGAALLAVAVSCYVVVASLYARARAHTKASESDAMAAIETASAAREQAKADWMRAAADKQMAELAAPRGRVI